MSTVEILFSNVMQPTESATFALARTKDVCGIYRLSFDRWILKNDPFQACISISI
jgi:hypothetical protein